LNFGLELSLNICHEFLNHGKYFRLREKKEYPSKMTIIINKGDKIFKMSMRSNIRHTPNITMNYSKVSRNTMSTSWKRKTN